MSHSITEQANVRHGGLNEPIHDAQGVFRAIMEAMALPGLIKAIGAPVAAPSPMQPAMAAAALTLADHDTPVWLDERMDGTRTVSAWLSFHTGAPVVSAPDAATFVFIADPMRMPPLPTFSAGTLEYPDTSATLLVEVQSLEDRGSWTLSGPGIEHTRRIGVRGLPDAFVGWLAENRARQPQGVDVLLTAGHLVVALPRTTRVAGLEEIP